MISLLSFIVFKMEPGFCHCILKYIHLQTFTMQSLFSRSVP